MHQNTIRGPRELRGEGGQHSRLAMTLFRMVLSSKTLISMSCSSSSSVSSTLLLTPLLPIFLPALPCLIHSTAGCHHVPCMPARAWATADLPFPKICSHHTLGTAGLSCSICFLVGGTKSPQDITRVPRSPFLGSPCSLQPDGQESRPLPTPGPCRGLPKAWRGTAVPTSPASCWNMFLKPSSMSSSVISSCSQKGSSVIRHRPCPASEAQQTFEVDEKPLPATPQTHRATSCPQLPAPKPRRQLKESGGPYLIGQIGRDLLVQLPGGHKGGKKRVRGGLWGLAQGHGAQGHQVP